MFLFKHNIMIDLPKICYDPRMAKHPGCGNANYALFEDLHLRDLLKTENSLRRSQGIHPVPGTQPSRVFSSPLPPYLTVTSAINFLEVGVHAFVKAYWRDPERNLDRALLIACESGFNAMQRRFLYSLLLPIVTNMIA